MPLLLLLVATAAMVGATLLMSASLVGARRRTVPLCLLARRLLRGSGNMEGQGKAATQSA